MANSIDLEKWVDFWEYFKGTPNQLASIQLLFESIPNSVKQLDSNWIQLYRKAESGTELTNPLQVKYFYQTDNGPEGWRQCQTSSIAMCLNFLKVPGITDDLDYLKIVEKYGDTTLQSSHQQALKSLNVPASFKTDGNKADLIKLIDSGRPVPMGILHHGPACSPSGGGHYITLIGYTATHAICHDPFGCLNCATGKWKSTDKLDGKLAAYLWQNLLPRWNLDNGYDDGWYWDIDQPKK